MTSCPFCELEGSRIFAASDCAVAIKDAFPVTPGHALVIPRRHVNNIYYLTDPEQAELWALVGRARQMLVEDLAFDSFNIGINDGTAAGQTIEHAHIHIIPRRAGDVLDPRGGIRHVIPAKARYWGAR